MRAARITNYIWGQVGADGLRLTQICVGLVFVAALACLAQDGHPVAALAGQTNATPQAPGNPSNEVKPQPDGANDAKLQKVSQAEADRKKQISDESTQLLAMAVALKAEVDKTTKDTLSLSVIRKADEIERMAKTVKERIKRGAGPN
ncbi:MAG: hypothetical protein WBQ95_08355 [Terracidiphilus sp.]